MLLAYWRKLLNADFAGLLQFVEQGERGERYAPVSFAVVGFAHWKVVWEGYEADPRRADAMLHSQGNGGDAPFFYRVADQPDGPVAQGSRRREQHDVYLVFYQVAGDFGGRAFCQRGRVVDGSHKGEVACR
jgi:hypothetical protein